MLGNIVIWYTGTAGVAVYAVLLAFYLLRRRRQVFDIAEADFLTFCSAGEVLLAGYLVHYLPYFFYDRQADQLNDIVMKIPHLCDLRGQSQSFLSLYDVVCRVSGHVVSVENPTLIPTSY